MGYLNFATDYNKKKIYILNVIPKQTSRAFQQS